MRIYAPCIMLLALAFIPFALPADELDAKRLLEYIEATVPHDLEGAEESLNNTATNAAINNSESLRSHQKNLFAFINILKNELPSALSNTKEARLLAINSGNRIQEAESYRREGLTFIILNQYPTALAMLKQSMDIYADLRSDKITLSIDGIINIYEELAQYDKQMEYSWLLLEEAIKRNDFEHIASAHHNIGLVFLARGELEQARYHFNEEFTAHQSSDEQFLITSFYAFAKLALAEGRLDDSLIQIEQAKTFITQRPFQLALPSILIVESDVRLAKGEVELATQLLNRALSVSAELSTFNNQLDALRKLAVLYESINDFENAFLTLKRKQQIEEESQLATERQLLAISQAQLDLDTKNREIDTLKYEQALSQQRQTNQFVLLAFTFVIIAFLTFFMLRLRKQKTALKLASEEVQRATAAKSDFLARMSHEIRTPINAIIGLTKLSLRRSEDQKQATNLKQVEESSQTLLGLINDILDFSKIEAGKMLLETSDLQLDSIIDSCIRMNTIKAQEKNLQLIKFIGPEVPMRIQGDALRLQQVLNNLLSNAVKFTDDGSISIVVNRQYSEQELLLQFEVKDTGRGLTTLQKESLFESFTQADESITRKYGGTGLGLAITKQLVELMGGKVWVESVPSQGASFFFTLKTQKSLVPDSYSAAGQDEQMRALIIDNEESSRQLIKQTLLRMEINPSLAVDGTSGIERMRRAVQQKLPFDLIILEWKMHDIDGVEVASIIRQEFNEREPKIIFMTRGDLSESKLLGEQLDVWEYLEKPLNASMLYDCVMGLTKRPAKPAVNVISKANKTPSWQHIHILLAEDNQLNRKVAIGYLEETRAKISIAENGEQAVSMLKADDSIDLILMDIQMPILDGLRATKIIRNDLALDVPIIAMTAHAIEEDVKKSIEAGMNAHIVKPIEPQLLLDTIQSMMDINNP